MANIVKTKKDLEKELPDVLEGMRQHFDEVLLTALQRRHLEVPAFTDVLMEDPEKTGRLSLLDHIMQNVRLFKLEEIAYDSDSGIHLAGVESVLSSMRFSGYSLLFVVQGRATTTTVYAGLSKFAEDAAEIAETAQAYKATWEANFPGSRFEMVPSDKANECVGYPIANCEEFGVLTGIPSLKRKEESELFVQGLERMIRAMRGKVYTWVSIADPMPVAEVRKAIEVCQRLQTEISGDLKTTLQKAASQSNTVLFGLFGMGGEGKSKSDSKGENGAQSDGTSTQKGRTTTDTEGETTTSSHTVGGSLGVSHSATVGATVGTTAGIAGIGSVNASATASTTAAVSATADYHYTHGKAKSVSKSIGESLVDGVMSTLTKGWATTITNAISSQYGGGGFMSFGRTWTKTTTVGQEVLNRKVEYMTDLLKKYETRLQEGSALGMWNLGHYFCAADSSTYRQGIGVVTSLFSGMDSTYEPPRAIKVPKEFRDVLRRFQNVYLCFPERKTDLRNIRSGEVGLWDHPLGPFFNGPATPVNTRELAIATPIATQDVEGVSVSRRPSFGINLPAARRADRKTITLGKIHDRGNATGETYRISQSNLPKHLAVFGLTGSGKTNTLHNLLYQLWKNERKPFLVLEPAKAEYRAMARYPELRGELLVFAAGVNRGDACPLRINPFDFDPGDDTDANRVHVLTHIDRLKATFNASFPMYGPMPYILEEAIIEVYRERGWDLGRSCNRYVDIYHEDFRDYIPTLQDLYWKIDDVVDRKGYAQEQTMNIRAALKSRISSLMVGAKGAMFNTRRSVPSEDLFTRPAVVELENMGDDDEKAFLMGLLVSRLYEYRKATYGTSDDDQNAFKHVLVIEEAHRLLANVPDTSANMEAGNPKGKAVASFVDMLSEIRSFGQSVFIVDQLPSRVSPNIVKGTGTKIVHRLLAQDDRESVGRTMGMDDAQINDLCLLKTGECAVSQDGDSKSYLCKVDKCENHEAVWKAEISEATRAYRDGHAELFEVASECIDREDGRFRDTMYKVMLAVGCGEDAELLEAIHPTRIRGEWENRRQWLEVYWNHVCAQLWGEHGGDYGSFLSLRQNGLRVLSRDGECMEAYRRSFAAYMDTSRLRLDFTASDEGVGIAFEPLLLGRKVMETVRKMFTGSEGDPSVDLITAIARALPMIEPVQRQFSKPFRCRLVREIVGRIPGVKVDAVLEKYKEMR